MRTDSYPIVAISLRVNTTDVLQNFWAFAGVCLDPTGLVNNCPVQQKSQQDQNVTMANSSFTPPSVFDRAHDNVAANGTIEDSRPSIQMFRSAFSPSAPNDCDARCSSL